jgi:hypothetical protein
MVLAGCTRQATQLLVVVDTDLAVPGELGFVRARVFDAQRHQRSTADFALAATGTAGPARFTVPFSFAVYPAGDDATRRVVVEVAAHGVGDETPRFVRRAVTGFVAGRMLLLPMFLAQRCVAGAATCAAGETCTERGCVSEVVPAESLAEVGSGQEFVGRPRRDASVDGPMTDGGADTGLETGGDGRPDTGLDAGLDAGHFDVLDDVQWDLPRDLPGDIAPTVCRYHGDCAMAPAGRYCATASGRCVECLPLPDTCPPGTLTRCAGF